MHRQGDVLAYDRETCHNCQGEGFYIERKPCPLQGRTVAQRPGRACPHCKTTNRHNHSYLDTGLKPTCWGCDGTGKALENRYSYMPSDLVLTLPLKVHRLQRGNSFNENYIGHGCLWSCQDYGRAAGQPDEEVLARVMADLRKGHSVQACAVVDKDDHLPNFIGIFVTRDGFSVRAVHDVAVKAA